MIYTLQTKDFCIRYIKFGHGKKNLVIIPGLSVKSVLSSEKAIASAYSILSDDYTVYLFDPRSDLPENYKIRDMSNDMAFALSALGIKQVYVFGVSMGGMAALQLAMDHPELVIRLVVGSTTSRMTFELPDGADAKEKAVNFIKKLYSDKFIESLCIPEPDADFTADELCRFDIMSSAAEGFDVYDRLGEIKCPMLVIGASEDKIIPAEESAAISLKTGCELYMYGAPYGHAVYDEAPDYKKRLFEFMQRNI